jgi:hypothetical protein
MEGSMIMASELYNLLACCRADKDENDKYFVRGNITSFMGAGEEFVIDSTAQFRREKKWCNLLHEIKATSYYNPVAVY